MPSFPPNEILNKTTEYGNSITLTLVILIVINIAIEIFKFFSSIFLSNKDQKNKRLMLIEEKRIKVLEKLFKSLDSLTLLDRGDDQLMLYKLKEINKYVTQNKIYIPKEFQKCTNEILDYFKSVLADYRVKSIEKETQLFENFCNEFCK